jgi:hypothetical protein
VKRKSDNAGAILTLEELTALVEARGDVYCALHQGCPSPSVRWGTTQARAWLSFSTARVRRPGPFKGLGGGLSRVSGSPERLEGDAGSIATAGVDGVTDEGGRVEVRCGGFHGWDRPCRAAGGSFTAEAVHVTDEDGRVTAGCVHLTVSRTRWRLHGQVWPGHDRERR